MQYVPTRFHGAFDYVLAAVLLAAVYPLGYGGGGPQTWVAVTAALSIVAYSLVTDYEWGVARRLVVPLHLALDLLTGIVLLASPWALGFAEAVWAPHATAGLLLIGAALTTHPWPYGMEHPAFLRVQGQSAH